MIFSLAFRHDTGWNFRRIIARVTGSPVHVALCFGDTVVIEADGATVRQLTRAQRFAAGQWSVVRVPVTDAQAQHAFDFARAQLGKQYDWLGVLWAWWWGKPAKLGSRDKWFCSELAVASLQAAGFNLQPARPTAWTPRKLWDWCASWR